MKPYKVNIQMKAANKYFLVVQKWTFPAVFSYGTDFFLVFYKMKFVDFFFCFGFVHSRWLIVSMEWSL